MIPNHSRSCNPNHSWRHTTSHTRSPIGRCGQECSGNVREERSGARGGESKPAAVATDPTQLPPIAWAVDSARDLRRLVRREERIV